MGKRIFLRNGRGSRSKMIEEYIEKQGKEEGYDNFSIGEE